MWSERFSAFSPRLQLADDVQVAMYNACRSISSSLIWETLSLSELRNNDKLRQAYPELYAIRNESAMSAGSNKRASRPDWNSHSANAPRIANHARVPTRPMLSGAKCEFHKDEQSFRGRSRARYVRTELKVHCLLLIGEAWHLSSLSSAMIPRTWPRVRAYFSYCSCGR